MRKLLPLALAALLAAGCATKIKQDSAVARTNDPTVGIDVSTYGTLVLKAGVLIVPVRVTNRRDRFVQVYFDRCEVEATNGERRHRRPERNASCTIAPGSNERFKLIFGDKRDPLPGDSFRIWLWVEPTDGSGVITGVPPLQFGLGRFEKEPHGFENANAGAPVLPPPTDPPPPSPPPAPLGADVIACPTCGEPRPKGSATCPHCGLP